MQNVFLRTRGDLIFSKEGMRLSQDLGMWKLGERDFKGAILCQLAPSWPGGDQRNCVKCARIVMRRAVFKNMPWGIEGLKIFVCNMEKFSKIEVETCFQQNSFKSMGPKELGGNVLPFMMGMIVMLSQAPINAGKLGVGFVRVSPWDFLAPTIQDFFSAARKRWL